MRLCILLSVFFALLCTACDREYEQAEHTKSKKARDAYRVQHARESMIFFQDTRTKLCFALMWGGQGNGGPGLAAVDCAIVKEHLIP